VSDNCLDLVMKYLNSEQKPDLIGFSVELKKSVMAGSTKNVITELIKSNILGITSLTLVTSTIFKRVDFSYELFWKYEPFWFPHSLSIYMTAIERDADCVLIKAKSKLLQESGNTIEERRKNSLSPYVVGLNKQFQSAILHFINRLAILCAQSKIEEDIYLNKVCERYKCKREYVENGMGKITGLPD